MAQQHGTTPADPAEAILTAIGRLGPATARDIAAEAGVPYSTTTRNLRELAAAGRAQKLTDDAGRALWRLPIPDTDGVTADAPDDTAPPADAPGTPDAGVLLSAPPDEEPAVLPADAAIAPDADAQGSDPAQPTPLAEPAADVDEATTPPPVGDVEQAAPTGQAPDPAEPADITGTGEQPTADRPQQPAAAAKPRRASGTLDGAVLDILEAHPDQGLKVSQLCKLIDAANEGSDTAKASPGAVVLAAQRLVGKGKAVLAVEKPATFQLATTTTSGE